ncbi:proline-rich protein 36-like isoform X2 [Dermacentor albipictus]
MDFAANEDPSEVRRTCGLTRGDVESRSPDSTVQMAGEQMPNDGRRQDLGHTDGSHSTEEREIALIVEYLQSGPPKGLASAEPSAASQDSRNELTCVSYTASTLAGSLDFRDQYCYSAGEVQARTGPAPARCEPTVPWMPASEEQSPLLFNALRAGDAPTQRPLPGLAAQAMITHREAGREMEASGGNESHAAAPFESVPSVPCTDANACRELTQSAAHYAWTLAGLHDESGNAPGRSRSRDYRKYEVPSLSFPGSEPPAIPKPRLDTFWQNSHEESCHNKEGPLASRSCPIMRSSLEQPPLVANRDVDITAILAIRTSRDSFPQSATRPHAFDAPVRVTLPPVARNTPHCSNPSTSFHQGNPGQYGLSDTGAPVGPIEMPRAATATAFGGQMRLGVAASVRSAPEQARPPAFASVEMKLSGAGRQQFMEVHGASFNTVHPANVTRQETHTALRGRSTGRDVQHAMRRPPVLVVQEHEPVPQPGSGQVQWPHEWQQADRRGAGPIRRGRKALAQPTAVAGLPRQIQSSANGTLWVVPHANASVGSQAALPSTSTPGSPALQQSGGRLPVGDNVFPAALLPCQLPPSSWPGGPTYPAPTPPPGPMPASGPLRTAGGQLVQTSSWNIPVSQPWTTPPITAAPSGKQLYSSPNDSLLPQPSPRSSAPLTARGRKRGRPRKLSPPAQPARAPQASAGPPGGGEEVNVAGPARPAEPPLRPQELTPAPPRAEYPVSPMTYHLHDVTEPDNFTEAEPFAEDDSWVLDNVIEILERDYPPIE